MPAPASEALLNRELGVQVGEPLGPSGLAQPHPTLAADAGLSPSALWAPPGSSAPVLPPFLGSAAAPALLSPTSSSGPLTQTSSSSHSHICNYHPNDFNLDQPNFLSGVPSSGHNLSAPLPKWNDLTKS